MEPTYRNTMLFLRESNAIEDVYDRTSLVQAHRAWKFLLQFEELDLRIVMAAHRILMKHQDIDDKYKGNVRDVPVSIGGEVKSQPPMVLFSLLRDWIDDVNRSDKNEDPVGFHVRFENIHPFIDGNGRIGRLLLNWHLVKRNGAPLLIYTKKDVHTYYMLFSSYRSRVYEKMYNEMFPGTFKERDEDDNSTTSQPV